MTKRSQAIEKDPRAPLEDGGASGRAAGTGLWQKNILTAFFKK
jgi:hypothetical protein